MQRPALPAPTFVVHAPMLFRGTPSLLEEEEEEVEAHDKSMQPTLHAAWQPAGERTADEEGR